MPYRSLRIPAVSYSKRHRICQTPQRCIEEYPTINLICRISIEAFMANLIKR
ncbi:hypothetical protein FOXYSP1_05313 [Fusarium oxysporum f. sp. phaseoli]